MRSPSVLEVCVARAGLHKGALAAANVAQWAIATHELGHIPTVVEYSEYWAVDERTGWRHRERVRAGLGLEGDAWRPVVEAVAAAIADKASVSSVTRTVVPELATA